MPTDHLETLSNDNSGSTRLTFSATLTFLPHLFIARGIWICLFGILDCWSASFRSAWALHFLSALMTTLFYFGVETVYLIVRNTFHSFGLAPNKLFIL